jgi:diguanylate cyclase (GGDEF)-like protein
MKKINDTYVHARGDEAIKAMAEMLRNTFRESDIIARIGGDEFAILIAAFRAGREKIFLDRLKTNINAYNDTGVSPCPLSISIAVFICDPMAECSIEEMLIAADARMYEQKAAMQKSRS